MVNRYKVLYWIESVQNLRERGVGKEAEVEGRRLWLIPTNCSLTLAVTSNAFPFYHIVAQNTIGHNSVSNVSYTEWIQWCAYTCACMFLIYILFVGRWYPWENGVGIVGATVSGHWLCGGVGAKNSGCFRSAVGTQLHPHTADQYDLPQVWNHITCPIQYLSCSLYCHSKLLRSCYKYFQNCVYVYVFKLASGRNV